MRFLLRPAAQADLSAIWDYSAQRWGTTQADDYVRAIGRACQDLADGTRHRQIADDIREGYLKMLVGSHLLFFRVNEDGFIDVIRILHERMDPTRHMTDV